MHAKIRTVAIGGSAGSVQSLLVILARLHRTYPLPILVVTHLPPQASSGLLPLLRQRCQLNVMEAEDKMPISTGTIYLAPPNYHLLVEPDHCLSLSTEEPVNYSRPSIDVLFETAADALGEGLIGIILTGANHDGAQGLKRIVDCGGLAVVQEPESAYAQAMPLAACQACPQARVYSLEQIADFLQSQGGEQ